MYLAATALSRGKHINYFLHQAKQLFIVVVFKIGFLYVTVLTVLEVTL